MENLLNQIEQPEKAPISNSTQPNRATKASTNWKLYSTKQNNQRKHQLVTLLDQTEKPEKAPIRNSTQPKRANRESTNWQLYSTKQNNHRNYQSATLLNQTEQPEEALTNYILKKVANITSTEQ